MKINKFLTGLTISVLALTGCGNTNSSSNEPEEIGSLNYTFVTDLDEEKEIHTEAQLTYLQYDGEYKTIDPNLYPGGTKHNSAPMPVEIEWEYTMLDGMEDQFKNFTVSYGQFKDLRDGYVVDAETTENGGKVSLMNVFMGTNYFKVFANYEDETVDEDEESMKEKALEDENVKRFIEGKEIVKIIVIKGRIINIVIKWKK